MDVDTDPISGLTNDEKHQNFLKILSTTRYLDDGGEITEDWLDEHKWRILQYREWIDDYSSVNSEIEDFKFRKCCSETETLIRQLCHSISATGTFNVKIYHIFIRHMKEILDTVYTDDDMAELLSMMSM
jgi:hypothetical protein